MRTVRINDRDIGDGNPCYVIAELSANHNQSLDRAKRLVRIAKECGADAVKLQTYTADTITLDCDNEYFSIADGPWKGQTLHQLYGTAFTPWEWHSELKEVADDAGITLFSTPFDATAVMFLESLGMPAYKIASFEIVDIPLLRKVGSLKKPVIMSTGMASLADIELAVQTLRDAGTTELVLLKCTSGYPADPKDMNLKTLAALAQAFGVPVGLSDHALESSIPVAAVMLSACVIEKHLTDDRSVAGPDAHFSMEPAEFKQMVHDIRIAEQARGTVRFGATTSDAINVKFRKSIFAIRDIRAGDLFTQENIRVIRPGDGLHPRHYTSLLGSKARNSIDRGTPVRNRDTEIDS